MSFSSEFDNQLFECSLLLLSLLLNEYKLQKIDITDFKEHAINKISYIKDNFDIINNSLEKRNIESLINECIEITTNAH